MAHSTKRRTLAISTTPEAAFGDGTYASERILAAQNDIVVDWQDERLQADFRAYTLQRYQSQVGTQKPTFPVTLPLFGSGVIANASTTTGTPHINEILTMGGFSRVDGGTAKAGATIVAYTAGTGGAADTIEVGTGQGARFAPGAAFYTQSNEIGWVKSVSGDVLTLARNLVTDPTVGGTDVLFAMRTYYPEIANPGELTSFAMKLFNSHKLFTLKGCVASGLKLTATPGQALMLDATVMGNESVESTATAANDPLSWTAFLKAFGTARCDLYIPGAGWLSPRYDSLEVDFGIEVADVPDLAGSQGRGGYAVTNIATKIAARNIFDDGTGGEYVRRSIGEYGLMADWFAAQGNVLAIYAPCLEINGKAENAGDLRAAAYTAEPVRGNASFGPGDIYVAIA
jgi:hypothetical protein